MSNLTQIIRRSVGLSPKPPKPRQTADSYNAQLEHENRREISLHTQLQQKAARGVPVHPHDPKPGSQIRRICRRSVGAPVTGDLYAGQQQQQTPTDVTHELRSAIDAALTPRVNQIARQLALVEQNMNRHTWATANATVAPDPASGGTVITRSVTTPWGTTTCLEEHQSGSGASFRANLPAQLQDHCRNIRPAPFVASRSETLPAAERLTSTVRRSVGFLE